MRRVDLDGSLQFSVYPGIADAAARENERVNRPAAVDHREPEIDILRDVAAGPDPVPHTSLEACEAQIRFDLAQVPAIMSAERHGRGRHGAFHPARKHQALS
jgi:hypothetical protein